MSDRESVGARSPATDQTLSQMGEVFEHERINVMLGLSVDQLHSQFKNIFQFNHHQTCLKEATLLDYFVAGFCWAKGMKFSSQQICGFMTLLQQLLDNIKDKQASITDNFKTLLQTLVARRQSSVQTDVKLLFDADEIKAITDYCKYSVFQHHELYELLFTQHRDQLLLNAEKVIEGINPEDFVAPLEEGMPTHFLLQHTQTPVCTPEQDTPEPHKEEEKEAEKEEDTEEDLFSEDEVREVLGEISREMLTKLQADFTEKLRVHEESYNSRLDQLQRTFSKPQ